MELDPTNPVVALCAAGMAIGGNTTEAGEYLAQAWAARRDDFEAAVAAHYVARVQGTPPARLAWDARAVTHAEAALAGGDARVHGLLASLYLNFGDGLLAAGRREEARDAAGRAEAALAALPAEGYRAFVAGGVARLRTRVDAEQTEAAT